MSDLVERVAMTIAEAEIEYFGPESSLVQCQSWTLCPDCYRNAARAVIALVRNETLEEAAKVADNRATELSILRDGAPHVDANGQLSWSDYNYCCVEIRSLAIELCKLALEGKHD